jgi:ParB family transcriptional regulator, chromosome partitioning protein
MQLEFHQLDRRWEHLRLRHPGRQRRLLASLAEAGQQMPIVVVATGAESKPYLVIDGYKRITALQQLSRDTVEAMVWPMSEVEALLLDRSLRLGENETALEQGWLLQELEQHFGYGMDELARRFDRSVSWVSRRLALVELLPDAVQQQVRDGKLLAHVAMKFLVPVARISIGQCERMATIFVQQHCDTREAGALYANWRKGSAVISERSLSQPELFLKTQRRNEPPVSTGTAAELLRDLEMMAAIAHRAQRRVVNAAELDRHERQAAQQQLERIQAQLRRLEEKLCSEEKPHVEPSTADHDFRTACTGDEQTRDLAPAVDLTSDGAASVALQGYTGSGVAPSREGRTIPATNPGAV